MTTLTTFNRHILDALDATAEAFNDARLLAEEHRNYGELPKAQNAQHIADALANAYSRLAFAARIATRHDTATTTPQTAPKRHGEQPQIAADTRPLKDYAVRKIVTSHPDEQDETIIIPAPDALAALRSITDAKVLLDLGDDLTAIKDDELYNVTTHHE